ncbi:permease of the major facilitator superfamily [Aspergillus flavus]|uniref:Permease of the major facilitator superfamily n=1 Tax=Aspergillus flavus (strain ATCC 200026 / FGSC A1120 / IAM 13836 / NRRL 3357 / JCM 12722 / SRRC 167) TaxID=332952 RepID=A0A7U2R133_ASPFN|nr:permease of the major facilitator superfamily [Aspergillus flavus]
MLISQTKPEQNYSERESNSDTETLWSAVSERKTRRKIDLSVLPLLLFGMTVFQLDRMNIASALTGGFGKDIHIDQSTVNLGNQLMFLGIIVLEIPSNLILQKIGPDKWIPAQVLAFGTIATFQVFLHNRTGFLVVRSLLGLAEAGYIPASLYTLSIWYEKTELAKRVGIFFFGMFGGNAISPLLGAGILKLDGKHGLKGWQWIFLIEGIFTTTTAIIILLLLPQSPSNPRPYLLKRGVISFSPEDRDILLTRTSRREGESESEIESETPSKTHHSSPAYKSNIKKALLNYRRWPHFLLAPCVFSTWSPLTTYTPTIMMYVHPLKPPTNTQSRSPLIERERERTLGFTRLQSNALTAIGATLALPLVFFFSYISDRTTKRGLTVIAAVTCYLIVLIVCRCLLPRVEGKWGKFGIWTVINAFAVCYHPVHNTWLQLNCRCSGERSIAIAMCKCLMCCWRRYWWSDSG